MGTPLCDFLSPSCSPLVLGDVLPRGHLSCLFNTAIQDTMRHAQVHCIISLHPTAVAHSAEAQRLICGIEQAKYSSLTTGWSCQKDTSPP